jgi:hypothetical protein
MIKRELILIILCTILIALTPSCKKYYSNNSSDGSTTDTSDDDSSGGDTSGIEATSDYTWDNSTITNIALNGSSATADNDCVTISGGVITISCAGTYNISGTLTNGQIIVKTSDDGVVRLILNGVNITCSNNAPVFVKKASKTVIILPESTDNYLTDGSSYVLDSDNEPNAALFSKSYLSFYGNGSLTVTSYYKDGITSKDGLVIKSGTINVNATDDGIRGKDYLIVHNGNITVNAKDDGIKSDNEDDASLGYITIDSATVKIKATGDGIKAHTNIKISDGYFNITTGATITFKSDSEEEEGPGGTTTTSGGYSGTNSEKGIKAIGNLTIEKGTFILSTADDALHSHGTVTINGGTYSISAGDDAIHAETAIIINDGTLNITKSYEGFESLSITVNSGNVNMVSTDDCFNATAGTTAGGTESDDGSWVYINGGNITLNASTGDGLDSNGSVAITGGTLIVNGPSSSPELGFDINGTFKISGGFVIGSGPNSGSMIEGPSSTSTQYSVMVTIKSTLAASTLFHIEDASTNNNLVTFKPVRAIYYVVFSSSDLKNGSTYNIYTGGSSTGTYTNGIYVGGSYSGGTKRGNFTVSNTVNSVSF